MVGRTLSHYEITAKLGEGGMGEVYRATDTRLGRDVALKVLPAEMAASAERLERFRREAKALAALDHPGIVTVFSVEEADSVHFLTMQLVEGQSLDGLISEGGLPAEQILELGARIAGALAAAHEKGIVHRDLKPGNVMVTAKGRVKVLDFGLARMSEVEEGPSGSHLPTELLTREGVVMGTVPYMSPEQVSGLPVDHRSDIFSLGVILYEMAIGRRPFGGPSSAELASAILRDTPPPLGELRPGLPDRLAQVIGRCLAKNAVDRWSSTLEVRDQLRGAGAEDMSVGAAPAEAARPAVAAASGVASADEGFWVAVLPFKYTDTDTDLAALAEGLSEEIVTGLSRFSYLRVIARSSTERYAGKAVDIRSIGKEIGARYVMEGSLRQAGSMLRVAVQLVDAITGAHLWAETYDRAFSPQAVFELQDSLVPRIVSTVADMHGILPRGMSETVRLKAADQLTPYEALLHSFGYNERFTPEALAEARSCLERAVEQSPGSADCWAMLSLMYSNEYGHWDIQTPESLEKALQAARKAVLVAPLNSLPYYALAQAHFFWREFPAARSAAERAVSLNPMDGATAAFMGLLIAYSGDWERGCELADRALELNPNLPGMYYYTRWHDAYGKKDYRRALELALKLNTPDSFYQHAVLAMCYAQLGEMDAAHKSLQDMLAIKADYGKVARKLHGKWVQPDLVEQLMDGLRKAGLEVADEEEEAAPSPARPASSERRADEGFWVAVLPFKYKGADTDLAALAEDLSEEIVTGLSRFSYLRVIARSSTERYAGEVVDVRKVGEEIGARYVMEGSLRQAGTRLRLAVQLVDATTGAHLWTETYERTFSPETVFELQDEFVPRIVSTVADWYGALPHSMSEAVRLKAPDQLSSYEAVLRSFGYFERISPEEHAAMRAALERAVEQAPGNADAWAMLSMMYGEEHRFGFNLQPDPLGRSLQAARRAVDAAHANHFAWLALAQALFFRREFDAFRDAAERAIALNPMDGSTLEYLGHLMAFSGDWAGGCEVAERARHLNPNHSGWYWVVHFLDHYRQGEYVEARPYILKTVLRGGGAQVFNQALLAAVYGQLGEREQAEQAVHNILSQEPGYAGRVREEFAKWYLPELVERLMEGLRKAGLEIADEEGQADASPVRHASGEKRADEGFWVAVLPFKYKGADTDLAALAEGLSEEIVTGLSRFSYLRVIARSSTERYAGEAADIRSIGKELGARYVMDGSLRQAGARLRLTVQLVDATTGAHLWAETYERTFDPEAVFELQDELVPRIVSTTADMNGALPRSMSEAVRNRDPEQLSPYEAVLRSFGYLEGPSADELEAARSGLESALREAPAYADAWAMLAHLHFQDYAQGFKLRPDSLTAGVAAARRAVEAGPSNPLAYFGLAQALFFQRERQTFRDAAVRAAALNPMDGNSIAFLGEMLVYSGDFESGLPLVDRAKQLNPSHSGWYWYADFYNAYRQGDYRGALGFALKVNLPGHWFAHAAMAAAYGQLGEHSAAAKAVRDLLEVRPDFAATVRGDIEKWWEPEYVEHIIDGWRKAGLGIPSASETGATATAANGGALSAPSEELPAETPSVPGFDGRPAIAVLPFENLSGDPEQEYFADGLAEDLIARLSLWRAFPVIARNSSFSYKGKDVDLKEVSAGLGVRYVVQGSVRKAGSRVRIAAQLVDAATGQNVWAQTYDRELTDVFAVQDEISEAIAASLVVDLQHAEHEHIQHCTPESLEAWGLYQRALASFYRFTPENFEQGQALLERATELEPGFSTAWARLAEVGIWQILHGWTDSPDETLERALEQARRAVDLDPRNAEAHAELAFALMTAGDGNAAIEEARRSMELNPSHPMALLFYAYFWHMTGHPPEDSIELVDRAMRLSPRDPTEWLFYDVLAGAYFNAGRFDDGLAASRRLIGLWPEYYFGQLWCAMNAVGLGQLEVAQAAIREARQLLPEVSLPMVRRVLGAMGPDVDRRMMGALQEAGLE